MGKSIEYLVWYLSNRNIWSLLDGMYLKVKNKTFTKSGYRVIKTKLVNSLNKSFYILIRKGTTDLIYATPIYIYEKTEKEALLRYINDIDLFIDIGANIGIYSLIFGLFGKKVVAFEPVSSNFEIFKLALGNEKGRRKIYVDPVYTGSK